MFNKIRNNNVLRTIYNVCYTILVIITLLILITVIAQRISNNNFSVGGIRIFNVVTGSMIPKYQVGDILVAKSVDPNNLKVGDDIVYQGNKADFVGKIVTHQIIDIEESEGKVSFHTKGIANDEEDPIVEKEQILGKIVYKTKLFSYIAKLINNLYSFYFIIFVPMAIILFVEIRRTIINLREPEEENEEENENEEEDR